MLLLVGTVCDLKAALLNLHHSYVCISFHTLLFYVFKSYSTVLSCTAPRIFSAGIQTTILQQYVSRVDMIYFTLHPTGFKLDHRVFHCAELALLLRILSTLSKTDTFKTDTKCPPYRELNKRSEERQGSTLGVRFTEVSVL